MEQTQNKQFRRVSRHPSEQTKERIRQKLTGVPKSPEHRQAISASMTAYWADDDNFPADSNGNGGWLTDLVEDITGDQ